MFGQLKNVVDLIRSGIADFRKFKTENEREEIVLAILRAYFLLKDCVDDGERLVADAGPNPVERIKAAEESEADSILEGWNSVLSKQARRLYMLQGYIFGQDHLAVINPNLQDELSKAVGYKMDRAITLHGIGAALFFREILPRTCSNEEKASYVSLMAGTDRDTLDMMKIKTEISSLREALDQYRAVVQRLVPD